jgi:hypothetical protein
VSGSAGRRARGAARLPTVFEIGGPNLRSCA